MKVLKRHIIGTNFHKKSKSTKIVKPIQYFLPSEKSIKLSKFWITVFKSKSITLIIETKYRKKWENLGQLKDGNAYYYKKYLSFQNLLHLGKLSRVQKIVCMDLLTQIPNKKQFCQMNVSKYSTFIFLKTLNFIMFVQILAYSMHNFCEWQNLKKLCA